MALRAQPHADLSILGHGPHQGEAAVPARDDVAHQAVEGARPIEGLADSKTLGAARRERLYDQIRAQALCCSIAQASVEEIDRLNILQATMLAMQRAVEGLRLRPGRVLVDGNRLPVLRLPAEAIVRGDARVAAIAAASILAKVTRDRWCAELHERHPEYGFATHKGYGTAAHLQALALHGACPQHRRSFAPVARALAASPTPTAA
ncbi:ribonuclease HII [Melaminivora alkalimesophila]|uniref:ribonuclease HII n=1 Tax=Melaminivora alkalimesophila TaxID=1165852 RepID=UPI0009DA4541